MRRSTRLLTLAAAGAALAGLGGFAASPSVPRVTITYAADKSATPLDGRLLLMLSTDKSAEPRTQIRESPLTSQLVFGVDVDGWKAGAPATIPGDTLGYPIDRLADVPPGTTRCRRCSTATRRSTARTDTS